MKYYEIFENPILLKKISFWCILGGLLIIVIFICSLIFSGFINTNKDMNMAVVGQVGDFLGGLVGSVWTLASIVLFVAALKIQSDQLENQKIEIQQQSIEISKISEENAFNRILSIVDSESKRINEKVIDILDNNPEGTFRSLHQLIRTLNQINRIDQPIGESGYTVFIKIDNVLQKDSFKDLLISINDSLALISSILDIDNFNNNKKEALIWIYYSNSINLFLYSDLLSNLILIYKKQFELPNYKIKGKFELKDALHYSVPSVSKRYLELLKNIKIILDKNELHLTALNH